MCWFSPCTFRSVVIIQFLFVLRQITHTHTHNLIFQFFLSFFINTFTNVFLFGFKFVVYILLKFIHSLFCSFIKNILFFFSSIFFEDLRGKLNFDVHAYTCGRTLYLRFKLLLYCCCCYNLKWALHTVRWIFNNYLSVLLLWPFTCISHSHTNNTLIYEVC